MDGTHWLRRCSRRFSGRLPADSQGNRTASQVAMHSSRVEKRLAFPAAASPGSGNARAAYERIRATTASHGPGQTEARKRLRRRRRCLHRCCQSGGAIELRRQGPEHPFGVRRRETEALIIATARYRHSKPGSCRAGQRRRTAHLSTRNPAQATPALKGQPTTHELPWPHAGSPWLPHAANIPASGAAAGA